MRTVVGVLRGGPSSEYDVSLKTGASILANLDRETYDPRDIFITRDGHWHLHGKELPPAQALRGVDVAFNAMHGHYGEDGTVQRLLENLGVPYTGSNAFASTVAFNKHKTKKAVHTLGVRTARHVLVDDGGDIEKKALEIFRSFPMPAIVKPVIGGSSVGTTIARDFQTLARGIEQGLQVAPKVLVEEFIKGREATVGIIEGFRGEKTYALLPIEVIPPENVFYDYHSKYISNDTRYAIPGNFSEGEKRDLMDIARRVHEGMELSHYSRSDFIVSKRGIYFLEVNTLPGMTDHSLIPKGLGAVGASLPDFLHHIISLARSGQTR